MRKSAVFWSWIVTAISWLTFPLLTAASHGETHADDFWPLVGITSIEDFLLAIIRIFILIGTPIAVLFMIYAGFLFVTARGNETQITSAKKTFFYTVIGIAILFGAEILARLVLETIKNIGVVP